MKEMIKTILDQKLIVSIIVVVILFFIYRMIKKLINMLTKKVDVSKDRYSRKKKTYLKLTKSIVRYAFFIIGILVLLQIYGVDVSSIIAGLGIVSVIAGLALQDALKDIIAGFNIIADDYFSVGDVIRFDNITGKVMELGLKATKIKIIEEESIMVVANRNIVKSITVSNQLDIDIPVPHERKAEEVEKAIDETMQIVQTDKAIEKLEYEGINEMVPAATYYKVRVWCKPEIHGQIRRRILGLVKVKLELGSANALEK